MNQRFSVFFVAYALLACASPPDENACASIQTVSLPGAAGAASPTWIVGSWRGPRVHYPAFTTVAVRHGLQRVPKSVECWVSFTATGPMAQQIGSVCQVLVDCNRRDGVATSEMLIRNSGAQDFWAMFILH
jgi:hypothetical protein